LAKRKIIVYKSDHCGVCAQVLPAIKELAKKKNISVKVIDVDACHTKECDAVKYTPLVKIDNREVSLEQLAQILKPEGQK